MGIFYCLLKMDSLITTIDKKEILLNLASYVDEFSNPKKEIYSQVKDALEKDNAIDNVMITILDSIQFIWELTSDKGK